jgi:glycosyltransferase involved in cell wall biosynthesis
MKLTLIVTTYNSPSSLLLVLESIKNQTILPDEVIVADDGSSIETKNHITSFNKEFDLNVIHIWQKDLGFRAARSRNNAIIKSSGDYIVMIDGDMVLHTKFIQDHIANAEIGFFVQGTRVLLSEQQTKKAYSEKLVSFSFFSLGLKNRKNAIYSRLLSQIFSSKNKGLRGIKSCNMGFYIKDCTNINGFNNDFEGWGSEDSEFAVRLINSGIQRKNVRFNAIQFHLWHNENSRILLEKNDKILIAAINNQLQCCSNGIREIEKNES